MKLLQSLTLSLLIILYGAPLTTRADAAAEVFALPDGRVAEAYQTDIEAVLRDRYRLKIETGVSRSILQWALADGELPPGLAVHTDGRIVGTPRLHRGEPYQFRVKVADQSVSGSAPLIVPLILSIAPPRLRLTSISAPALVPLETATRPEVGSPASEPPARRVAEGEAVGATNYTPQASRAAGSPPPITADAADGVAPLTPASPARRQTGGGGLLSKMAGVMGLGQGDGGRRDGTDTATGCAAGSSARRVISDEAHTPLEGDTSTQNTCVQFTNLNTLKYRYEFGNKTTRSEGPNISSLPFLPKITLTSTTATTAPTTPAASPTSSFVLNRTLNITDKKKKEEEGKKAADELANQLRELSENFQEARNDLSDVERKLRDEVEIIINENISKVEDAYARSKGLADGADLYLQSGNTDGLLKEVAALKTRLEEATAKEWPSGKIAEVLNALDRITVLLEDIKVRSDGSLVSQEAWKEWIAANEGRYNRVRDRIAELKTKVNTINNGTAAFTDSKKVLGAWQLVVNNVDDRKAAAFRQEAFVSCQTDEAEGESSQLTIRKTDRTSANATAVTRDVLTVNCYSRVAVTGGFNFSTLDEKEFSVVQSAGTEPGSTVKKFGFTSRSSFRPNPLMLLNVRFTDRPVYNWHASFGAVVDLKGQTGTDIEPVAGVSVSIRRIIFITPFAVHFGRVNRLAGGFREGDLVPESIATPPLEKAWKVGYTAGVTFRIAPQ